MTAKNPPKKTSSVSSITASFRDPSGYVFSKNGIILRQINKRYKSDYELLMTSGLYSKLTEKEFLISHAEVNDTAIKLEKDGWKIIQPIPIPFISYWYEWPFEMLKDAAVLTLQIQKIAIQHGMSLKDASAFNIQFLNGKPILIDTLSFEKYEEGKPWVAYKQFVEHFLSPLAVMAYVDVRLSRLGNAFLDGIPVDLCSHMLPIRARLNPRLLFHIFAHAATKQKYSNKKLGDKLKEKNFGKRSLLGLLDNLEGAVKSLKWKAKGTEWEDYYEKDKNNYKSVSIGHKETLVRKFVTQTKAKTVWDLGANTGRFSAIAAETGAQVVAFDIDYGAIEKNYRDIKTSGTENVLPLFFDMMNPTPALGWEGKERMSLFERGPADCILALALIHHLAIPHNVPFDFLASAFSRLGKYLVVEFIDKKDSQVQILLANRPDIFVHYTKEDFERSFENYFKILEKAPIQGSLRTLYLMERR